MISLVDEKPFTATTALPSCLFFLSDISLLYNGYCISISILFLRLVLPCFTAYFHRFTVFMVFMFYLILPDFSLVSFVNVVLM